MSDDALDHAVEVFLDVMLVLVDGKDDDDLVFVDGFVRSLAEQLGIDAGFPEIEPMTAGTMRERWRNAKGELARGAGPSNTESGHQ